MLMSRMSTVVHGIERLLDLLPEPLVLRALEDQGPNRAAVGSVAAAGH